MFYFIVYEFSGLINPATSRKECEVIDEHPITWYNDCGDEIVLLNWKQISEEEFNMWGKE